MVKSNIYLVKTQKLASHLMQSGFKLLRTDKDRNNPNLNIFLFKNTPELQEVIDEYIGNLKNSK